MDGDTVVCGGNALLRLASGCFHRKPSVMLAPRPRAAGQPCRTCWAGLANVARPRAKASGPAFLLPTRFGSGLLLLANRYVPLGLALLAPVIVNIAAPHFVVDPSGAPMAVLFLVLEAYLGWAYRGAYRGVLAIRAEPTRRVVSRTSTRVPAQAG